MPGGIPVPGWLSGVFSWGHKVTKEMEGEAEPAPVDDSLATSRLRRWSRNRLPPSLPQPLSRSR